MTKRWKVLAMVAAVLGGCAMVSAPPATTAEFKLMTRLFAVMADPSKARLVPPEGDPHRFLLSYSRAKPFRYRPDRSLFVDGEILMMLATTKSDPARMERYAARVVEQMEAGPILSGESYPDECWTFCNTMALAGLAKTGGDYGDLSRRWVAQAKKHLIDEETGLLISAYTLEGEVLQGPEGSSIWMSLHNLRAVDEAFAAEQYALAKKHLAVNMGGLMMAREWPGSGMPDIDSGLVVPWLGAGSASSGLAMVAAAAFDDDAFYDGLARSLSVATVVLDPGTMGHAVIDYAQVLRD